MFAHPSHRPSPGSTPKPSPSIPYRSSSTQFKFIKDVRPSTAINIPHAVEGDRLTHPPHPSSSSSSPSPSPSPSPNDYKYHYYHSPPLPTDWNSHDISRHRTPSAIKKSYPHIVKPFHPYGNPIHSHHEDNKDNDPPKSHFSVVNSVDTKESEMNKMENKKDKMKRKEKTKKKEKMPNTFSEGVGEGEGEGESDYHQSTKNGDTLTSSPSSHSPFRSSFRSLTSLTHISSSAPTPTPSPSPSLFFDVATGKYGKMSHGNGNKSYIEYYEFDEDDDENIMEEIGNGNGINQDNGNGRGTLLPNEMKRNHHNKVMRDIEKRKKSLSTTLPNTFSARIYKSYVQSLTTSSSASSSSPPSKGKKSFRVPHFLKDIPDMEEREAAELINHIITQMANNNNNNVGTGNGISSSLDNKKEESKIPTNDPSSPLSSYSSLPPVSNADPSSSSTVTFATPPTPTSSSLSIRPSSAHKKQFNSNDDSHLTVTPSPSAVPPSLSRQKTKIQGKSSTHTLSPPSSLSPPSLSPPPLSLHRQLSRSSLSLLPPSSLSPSSSSLSPTPPSSSSPSLMRKPSMRRQKTNAVIGTGNGSKGGSSSAVPSSTSSSSHDPSYETFLSSTFNDFFSSCLPSLSLPSALSPLSSSSFLPPPPIDIHFDVDAFLKEGKPLFEVGDPFIEEMEREKEKIRVREREREEKERGMRRREEREREKEREREQKNKEIENIIYQGVDKEKDQNVAEEEREVDHKTKDKENVVSIREEE